MKIFNCHNSVEGVLTEGDSSCKIGNHDIAVLIVKHFSGWSEAAHR